MEERSSCARMDVPRGEAITGIDVMRAFFAVCVVAIHTGLYPIYESTTLSLARCMDVLLQCAVPFFFISTGYFMGGKMTARLSEAGNESVLLRSLAKSLRSYGIWTAVYLPITIYYYLTLCDHGAVWAAADFLRGLFFRGEHWNSWMLWYLLSQIYALLLLLVIRCLHGSWRSVYILSALLFLMAGIYKTHIAVMAEPPAAVKLLLAVFGDTGRLFVAPFYLAIGVFVSHVKELDRAGMRKAGIPLALSGFCVRALMGGGGGYSEFSLAACTSGIFLLACSTGSELRLLKRRRLLQMRFFSELCYYTHMLIYTALCLSVWGGMRKGAVVFCVTAACAAVLSVMLFPVFHKEER